jgi:predicted nucleic acid-binding protein
MATKVRETGKRRGVITLSLAFLFILRVLLLAFSSHGAVDALSHTSNIAEVVDADCLSSRVGEKAPAKHEHCPSDCLLCATCDHASRIDRVVTIVATALLRLPRDASKAVWVDLDDRLVSNGDHVRPWQSRAPPIFS